MTKRIAIYTRVSPIRRPSRTSTELDAVAPRMGWEIVATFADVPTG